MMETWAKVVTEEVVKRNESRNIFFESRGTGRIKLLMIEMGRATRGSYYS